MTLLILLATAYIPPRPPECVWQRCGVENKRLINCEPEEQGSRHELSVIVSMTRKGAVTWTCRKVDMQ